MHEANRSELWTRLKRECIEDLVLHPIDGDERRRAYIQANYAAELLNVPPKERAAFVDEVHAEWERQDAQRRQGDVRN